MKKNYFVFILIIFLFGCSQNKIKEESIVTVFNKSGLTITIGELRVCNHKFNMGKLETGSKIVFKYYANTSDSPYFVFVKFESGKQLNKEVGYVSSDAIFDDNIFIESEKIKFERKSVK